MDQRGSKQLVLLLVVAIVLIGIVIVGYLYYEPGVETKNNNTNTVVEKNANTNSNINTTITNTKNNWQAYKNEGDCYLISHPNSFYVWEEHNLINFDPETISNTDFPPEAIKIQLQKHSLKEGQSFEEMIIEYNRSIEETGGSIDGETATLIEEYDLGRITHHNTIMSGPGGNFEKYIVPTKDNAGYYYILVWNMENDEENIKIILSSFTPLPCEG